MTKLEKLTHISLITVSIAALFAIIDQRFQPRGRTSPPSESSFAGKKVDVETPWRNSRMTVVVAMTTHCPYCIMSLPLYRRIGEIAVRDHSISFLAVTPEAVDPMRDLLSQNDVAVSGVIHSSLPKLGTTVTPSLFAVNSEGTIMRAFIGKLPEAKEAELFAMLKQQAP